MNHIVWVCTFGQERIQSWTVHDKVQSWKDRITEETADG